MMVESQKYRAFPNFINQPYLAFLKMIFKLISFLLDSKFGLNEKLALVNNIKNINIQFLIKHLINTIVYPSPIKTLSFHWCSIYNTDSL